MHAHIPYGTQPFAIGLYFAAKQGVAAKGGKETRPFLFAVLELLEKVRIFAPASCLREGCDTLACFGLYLALTEILL